MLYFDLFTTEEFFTSGLMQRNLKSLLYGLDIYLVAAGKLFQYRMRERQRERQRDTERYRRRIRKKEKRRGRKRECE